MAEQLHHRHDGAAHGARTVYGLLFPVPVVCFVATVATDMAYAAGAQLMWLHFSEWLIAVGLAFGALAALALLVRLAVDAALRNGASGWLHVGLFVDALVVEVFNALFHSIDGWTAVVPTGMALSIIGALLALAAVATLIRLPAAWVERQPEMQT